MSHTIEIARSGRAKCRKCKAAIAKDELRFGEEVPNAFSESGETAFQWYHLACAAKSRPVALAPTLAAFEGDVPHRADLERVLAESAGKQKPSAFPYAERAPTGRSRCISCEEAIEKGTLRVAIEREVDTGSFVTQGAGYLHPACARSFVEDEKLLEKLRTNSTSLDTEGRSLLETELK